MSGSVHPRLAHEDARAWAAAGALGVALAGCGFDLAALRGRPADAAFDAATSDTSGHLDAPPTAEDVRPAADVPASSARDADDAARPPPEDTAPVPTCGLVGLACCATAPRCATGVCMRGSCVGSGGAFATVPGCAAGCASRNVYTAGCSCPLGFDAAPALRVRAACATVEMDAVLTLCEAPTLSVGDYGGAYLARAGATSCPSCVVPNRVTGECACPGGAHRVMLTVDATDGCAEGGLELAICEGDTSRGTFAGAYQLDARVPGGCSVPNTMTGTCSCPTGTTTQVVPIMLPISGGNTIAPVHLCWR